MRPRQLIGLVSDTRAIPRQGYPITQEGDTLGVVTSGTFSPTLGKSIALARLPADAKPGDTVHVIVRDKPLEARVVKPPFVRNGKILVS